MTEPPQPPPPDPGQPEYRPSPGQYGPPPQQGQYGPPPQQSQYGPPPQQSQYGQPYGDPGYPPQGYPSGAGGYPPAPAPQGLKIDVGVRARRRPDARAGVTIAGAGAALVIVGILVWAGGYYFDGFDIKFNEDTGATITTGESRRFLGAGLFLVVALAGYFLMIVRRRGPLATAGAVAGGIGIPLAIIFVSLSISDTTTRGEYPFNLDAVYLISIVAWLFSYFVVPGAKGRAFFLTLAALGLASYVGIKASGNDLLKSAAQSASDGPSLFGSGTFAAVGIAFGLVYYLVAAWLDRSGRGGAAVAFVISGLIVLTSGIAAGADDFGLAGTGVALLLLGALLTCYGGYFGRRLTTWVWAISFVLGIFLIVAKISPDSYTAAGITFIVVGAIVVGGAQALSAATRERPDIDETEAPAPIG